MSNFSLRPLALECRTLTKAKFDQGACWSLCGCSHKHRHAQGSARLECGTTIKMAQYSGKYTNPMSELYASCLAKALLDNSLIDQTRDQTKESEMTRKMSRHTLKKKPTEPQGSRASRCSALHYDVPVMEMPTSEPWFGGVAEDVQTAFKNVKIPARLKTTAELGPIPKAIPTADR